MTAATKRYCDSCGKPLGSTINKCHQCGGKSYRAGKPYDTGGGWKVDLGLLPQLNRLLSGGRDE